MRTIATFALHLFVIAAIAQINPNPPKPPPATSAPKPSARPSQPTSDPIAQLARDMVRVEGGAFDMGCRTEVIDNCHPYFLPKHRVLLDSYSIGRYEVTQELWAAVMGKNHSKFEDCLKCPVAWVSWDESQEFIQRLNAKTGRRYRLPTEAEWEYAARGGRYSKQWLYAGSNNLEAVGWYEANAVERTHPVGQQTPNELGLYDMSGNVSEWCEDRYDTDYYAISPQNNPTGPAVGGERCVRGGYFRGRDELCQVHFRYEARPANDAGGYFGWLGFRLASTE